MKVIVLESLVVADPDDPTKSYAPTPRAVTELPDVVAQQLIDAGQAEKVSAKTPVTEQPEEGTPAPKVKAKKSAE